MAKNKENTESYSEKDGNVSQNLLTGEEIIAAARAEADRIIAEAEERLAAETEKRINKLLNKQSALSPEVPYENRPEVMAEIARGNEKVETTLFFDGEQYKDDVYVSCGAENCLIKRGVKVMVKRKFKNILEQSKSQDLLTRDLIDSLDGNYIKYN